MQRLLLVAMLVGAGACHKGATGMLDDLQKLQERMCACKDLACAQHVADDLNAWKRGLPKEDPKMSPADEAAFIKRSDDLAGKYEACMKPWKDQGLRTKFEH